MSGPLRRNKRSRPADAGEPLQEGLAAESEGAAPTADTPPESGGDPVTEPLAPQPDAAAREEAAADESARATTPDPTPADESARATTPDPSPADESARATTPDATAADEPAPATPATEEGAPAAGPPRSRRRLFGRRRKRARADGPIAPAAAAPAPVLLADPAVPAGIDPADAPMRPPAGRRGRLRRRLRYLRRARELMLRDLGGLLYEVHRTGGGNVEAHATVVGAKVQRIAGLDAEAHALEAALAAPRSETVVFEPGVGGTCATCGELYGSDARFCSNCGAAVGATAPAAPASDPSRPASGEPARRSFWRRAARAPEAAPAKTDETEVLPPAAGDETPGPATSSQEAAAPPPPGEEPSNPGPGHSNGRAQGDSTSGVSPGDPLVSRESRP